MDKKTLFKKYEGKKISYRGLSSIVTAVTSIGIEIVTGTANGGDILDFEDFKALKDCGLIKIL